MSELAHYVRSFCDCGKWGQLSAVRAVTQKLSASRASDNCWNVWVTTLWQDWKKVDSNQLFGFELPTIFPRFTTASFGDLLRLVCSVQVVACIRWNLEKDKTALSEMRIRQSGLVWSNRACFHPKISVIIRNRNRQKSCLQWSASHLRLGEFVFFDGSQLVLTMAKSSPVP